MDVSRTDSCLFREGTYTLQWFRSFLTLFLFVLFSLSCSCTFKDNTLALYSSDCFLKTLGYSMSLPFNTKLHSLASKVTAYILSFAILLSPSQKRHFCCLTVLLSTHFQHSLLSTVSQNSVRILSVNFRFDLASPLSEICQRVSIVLRIKSKHF